MVEVSPALRQKQWETLRCERAPNGRYALDAESQTVGAPAFEQEPASQNKAVTPTEDAKLSGISAFGSVKVPFPLYILWRRTLAWLYEIAGMY